MTIPDSVGVSRADAQIMLAIKLFETKRLPLGKAAEVTGLSYRTFYELLIKYGVPIVALTEDDIRKEIENAGRF
jgi:predicted HTH domain antitoxin